MSLTKTGGREHRLKRQLSSPRIWKRFGGKFLLYFVIIALTFTYIIPFVYMITLSMKQPGDLLERSVVWLPRSFYLGNFITAAKTMDYWHYFFNSFISTILPTIGHILSCSIIGYGFARFYFKGRELLFMLLIFTLIVPPQSIVIPLFMQYANLGWTDTLLPIIVPSFFGLGLRGALFVFIFRQFFRGLPVALEDASRIDGCGAFRTYISIVMPSSSPAILTTTVLSIVWHWNDYFEPMVFLNTNSKFTLPMLIPRFFNMFANAEDLGAFTEFNPALAMACVALVLFPMLIFYLIAQRWFIRGIERTGLAGD